MMFTHLFFRIMSSYLIDKYFKESKIIKMNFGCGMNLLDGWLNLDMFPLNRRVCYINCAQRLPFCDNKVNYIYTEHLIEHLSLNQFINFIKESYRILRIGGKIRIVTPDLEFFIKMYNSPETNLYLGWYEKRKLLNIPSSFVNCINSIFYEHNHRFIYDYTYLSKLLTFSGFKEVLRYEIGKSATPIFNGLERHGRIIGEEINSIESMAIEAIK